MSFRQDLCARIKFAAFGEHASHRIKRIETLSFPQEVDEINNRAIEMTFNEINVIAVRLASVRSRQFPSSMIAPMTNGSATRRLGCGGCFFRNSAHSRARSGLFSQKYAPSPSQS
jgi:hypothetical protein